MNIGDVLAIANSLFGFSFGVLNFIEAKRCFNLKHANFIWLKMLLGMIGIYWGGIYMFVFFADPTNYNSIFFGQVFIRPANTFMFGILLATAIMGWRKPCGER